MKDTPFEGTYTVTQEFGVNPAYYLPYGFKGHEGLDLVPTPNIAWNVYAVESGTVVRDVDVPRDNYGIYCTILNKTTGRSWWYCHLQVNNLSLGQEVSEGQLIGIMGSTGKVSGAHLHLGLRMADSGGNPINTDNGYKGFIDPLPILESAIVEDMITDQTKINIGGSFGEMEVQAIRSTILDGSQRIKTLTDDVSNLKTQLDLLQAKTDTLTNQLLTSESTVKTLTDQLTTLDETNLSLKTYKLAYEQLSQKYQDLEKTVNQPVSSTKLTISQKIQKIIEILTTS